MLNARAIALAVTAACLATAAPALRLGAQTPRSATDSVDVVGEARGVRLANRSDERIYLALFERTLSERIDWMPCTVGPQCDGIQPGSTKFVPWDSIAGFSEGSRDAHVFLWRLIRDANGRYRNVDMRVRTISRHRVRQSVLPARWHSNAIHGTRCVLSRWQGNGAHRSRPRHRDPSHAQGLPRRRDEVLERAIEYLTTGR